MIVIIGPTGSGKTAKALELAKEGVHELVNTDSMQIYKDLSIGNAKGKLEKHGDAHEYPEKTGIPVWGMDLINVTQSYSVAEFQKVARGIIDDIISRGKTPILVGGSGLYVAAIVYNYEFLKNERKEEIISLYGEDIDKLQTELIKKGFDLDSLNNSDRNNPRRLQNYLAKDENDASNELKPVYEFELIRLEPYIDSLRKSLRIRSMEMVNNGFLDEVESLIEEFGIEEISPQIRTASGYREVFAFLNPNNESHNEPELIKAIYKSHLKLARKQLTWNKKYFK